MRECVSLGQVTNDVCLLLCERRSAWNWILYQPLKLVRSRHTCVGTTNLESRLCKVKDTVTQNMVFWKHWNKSHPLKKIRPLSELSSFIF